MANDLVVNISADSEDLDRGLQNIKQNLAIVGDSLIDIGNSINDAFKNMIGSAMEASSAINKFQIQTGVSAKETAAYGKEIKQLYKEGLGESLEDVESAMAKVKQQSKLLKVSSVKDTKEMTEGALLLQDSFEYEVNESIRATGAMIQAFGIDGKDAFDMIARGTQLGLNKTDDLLDTLNEYSPKFAGIGLSANDMFTILKTGSESGAFTVDKVADAVKEFSIRTIDGSKATNEAFASLGLNAGKMGSDFAKGGEKGRVAFQKVFEELGKIKDPMKQNEIGVALFGTMFEDLGAKGVLALSDLDNGLGKTKGTLDKIKEIKLNQVGVQFEQLKRTIQLDVVAPLGEVLLPILKKIVGYAKQHMPAISEAIKNINPVIVIVVAAFGAFIGILTKIIGIVGILMPAIDAVIAIIGGITLPIWGVIAGVVALIAIFILFKDEIIGAIKAAYNTVAPIIQAIWGLIQEKWNTYVKPIIDSELPRLKNTFQTVWNNISTNLQTVIPVIIAIINSLKPIFELLIIVIKTVLSIFIAVFGQIVGFLTDTVKNIATIFNGLVTTITGIFNVFAGIFTGDWERVWNGIQQIVSGVGTALKGIVQQALNFILTMVGSILNSVASIFGQKFNNIRSIVQNAWNDMVRAFVDGKNRVMGTVGEFASNVVNKIREIGSQMYQAGKHIIQQLINGIKSKISGIVDTIKGITNTISSYFPHSPAKEGALKMFPKVGGNLMDQLIDGIEASKIKLNATVGDVSQGINNIVPNVNVSTGNGGNVTIPIYLDGRKITEVVAPLMTKAIRMQGG